jgi:hypothetical protein
MTVIPARNLASVDELLRAPSPKAGRLIQKIEEVNAWPLLNHHASEVDRWLSRSWEQIQLGLGVILLLCLFFGAEGKRYTVVICLLMLAAVAFLHWFLTPEMEKLAEAVDFALPGQPSVARDRLWSLKSGYSITETIKLILGALMAGGLLLKHRHRHPSAETD